MRVEAGACRVGERDLAAPGAPVWIDCAPAPGVLAWLGERYHFHPLALEDCAHEGQREKYEQYDGNLFTVVHRIAPSPDDTDLLAFELHAFLTAEALVTVHSVPIPEVDAVWDRCLPAPDVLARGPDFALYLVEDALTDVHFRLVDALTLEIEEIAEEVMSDAPGEDLLQRILAARRQHALLRKRVSPQREVFAALARPGQPLVRDQTAVYFRDVVDHAVRLMEEVDMGRDLLASAMDAHLSQTNNRLSLVTTRLTVVASIFLPLNFVAGFFGMNLEIFPPAVSVAIVVVSLVATPLAMVWFFRKRRWI
jgi:magnesium transporter